MLEELQNTSRIPMESSFRKHHPDIHSEIRKVFPELIWGEALYRFVTGKEPNICPVCGKPTSFRKFNYGYNQFCSQKCTAIATVQLREETCLKKYGVKNPCQSKSIIQKRNKTNQGRYGGNSPHCDPSIIQRANKTNQERYGGTGYSSKEIQQKIQNTNRQRIGVNFPSQNPDIQKRIKDVTIKRHGCIPMIVAGHEKVLREHPFIISTNRREWICKCPHPGCTKCEKKQYKTFSNIYWNRKKRGIELCTNLLPISDACIKGTSLELFVREVLDKYHIDYQANNRSILNPKEIDIYVPSKNLALECNGLYWHSDQHKTRSEHTNKWKICKEQNIQLLYIWEDWIKNKPEIIKSILLSKLGIFDQRIPARKTKVSQIDGGTARKFLIENHLQGSTSFAVAVGLHYNAALVAVMTFGKKRGCSGNKMDEGWDLSRFCVKMGYQILGGASKCLAYFEKNYNPSLVYSFSLNDISDGGLYRTLGFEPGSINRSYWYIDPVTFVRYHRSTFTKTRIKMRGWAPMDREWTEKEVMDYQGFIRIYDSGTTKWIKKYGHEHTKA